MTDKDATAHSEAVERETGALSLFQVARALRDQLGDFFTGAAEDPG
jgi:hypothetical protein